MNASQNGRLICCTSTSMTHQVNGVFFDAPISFPSACMIVEVSRATRTSINSLECAARTSLYHNADRPTHVPPIHATYSMFACLNRVVRRALALPSVQSIIAIRFLSRELECSLRPPVILRTGTRRPTWCEVSILWAVQPTKSKDGRGSNAGRPEWLEASCASCK